MIFTIKISYINNFNNGRFCTLINKKKNNRCIKMFLRKMYSNLTHILSSSLLSVNFGIDRFWDEFERRNHFTENISVLKTGRDRHRIKFDLMSKQLDVNTGISNYLDCLQTDINKLFSVQRVLHCVLLRCMHRFRGNAIPQAHTFVLFPLLINEFHSQRILYCSTYR